MCIVKFLKQLRYNKREKNCKPSFMILAIEVGRRFFRQPQKYLRIIILQKIFLNMKNLKMQKNYCNHTVVMINKKNYLN